MTLNAKQRKALKAQGHHLKPVIMVGQKGITDSLVAEAEGALDTHELIKVQVACNDRQERGEMMHALADRCQAVLVDKIGKICLLYRKREDG